MPMSVRFSHDVEQRLSHLAKETHRTKTFYVQQAIENFLEKHEAYLLAVAVKERMELGQAKISSLKNITEILDSKKT